MQKRLRASEWARMFGFELAGAEPGRAAVRMRVRARHLQGYGVVHGGILAALADTAGGLACHLAVPRRVGVATIEMKINFLEPVASGVVTADARVLRKGQTTAVVDCDLLTDEGVLVAKALLTFSIAHRRAAMTRRRRR